MGAKVDVLSGVVDVANSQSATVSQVDPDTLTVTRTDTVGSDPRSIAVARDDAVSVGLGTAKALTVLTLSATQTASARGRSTSPRGRRTS